MNLITHAQRQQLIDNGETSRLAIDRDAPTPDFTPVARLFTPDANAVWLLTELADDTQAFGLCDLGLGCPELGYVDLAELASFRGPFGPAHRTGPDLPRRPNARRIRHARPRPWQNRPRTDRIRVTPRPISTCRESLAFPERSRRRISAG